MNRPYLAMKKAKQFRYLVQAEGGGGKIYGAFELEVEAEDFLIFVTQVKKIKNVTIVDQKEQIDKHTESVYCAGLISEAVNRLATIKRTPSP